MKVEILTEFKHSKETYFPGEIIIFPEEDKTGEYFCRAGWAKDVDGIVPTANPSPQDVVLEIQNLTQNQLNPEIKV